MAKRSYRKGNSGNRVSVESRVEGFKLYAEGLSLKEIGKEIGCHENTVKRYKKEDDWDRRLDEIYDTVLDKVNLNISESLTKTLLTAQTFKHKLLTRLQTLSPQAMPVTLISQLREMHDLEQELIGTLHSVDESGELSLYTNDQLNSMLRDDDEPSDDA